MVASKNRSRESSAPMATPLNRPSGSIGTIHGKAATASWESSPDSGNQRHSSAPPTQ